MCCDYCEYWRVSTGIMALGSVVWMCRDYLHSQKFRDGWSRDVQECWRLKLMAIASYEVTEVQTFAVSSKKIVLYILIYLKLELKKKKKKNQTNNNTKKTALYNCIINSWNIWSIFNVSVWQQYTIYIICWSAGPRSAGAPPQPHLCTTVQSSITVCQRLQLWSQ